MRSGRGFAVAVPDAYKACEAVTGKKIATRITDRRPGDPPALVADASKIRRRLGWKLEYPDITRIVETAWAWHSRRPDGYGDR